jgi:outer membrane protein assembly factor BamB
LKNFKNKRATLMALFLMFAMAISLVALPSANAQGNTKATYAFIGATPNPVGVGQETLLHFGISEGLAATADGWEGITVTVEKPDNTTQTLGPYRTDSTGGTGDVFIPDMPGTYYLQTHFPEQNFTWGQGMFGPGIGVVTYKASTSEKLALNVTETPVEIYPGQSLPNEYWSRPIDSQLREWYTIAGNWEAVPPNRFAPYNEYAPDTAHILWTTPLTMGGLAGGQLGLVGSGGTSVGMETGDAYEGFFLTGTQGSVILNGRLYYNEYKSNGGTGVEQDVVCVDLHTGEQLWVRNWNNTRLAFGQQFYFQSWNYQGTYAFLWTTEGGGGGDFAGGPPMPETWNAYDAFTGRWVYSMTNVPSGTNIYGPNGAIYRYTVDLANGWMMLWNTSRVVTDGGSFSSGYLGQKFNVSMYDWNTRPSVAGPQMMGGTGAYTNGYEWNKTIPTGLPGSVMETFLEDRIIGSNLGGSATGMGAADPSEIVFWGINAKPGHEGDLLFKTTWTPPAGNLTLLYATANLEDGVFIVAAKDTRQLYGFSLDTGELLWTTQPQNYLNVYTLGESRAIPRGVDTAYDKVFSAGVAGIVYCYDVKTGDLLWTYEAKDLYTENLFSSNWWLNIAFVTDGKIYLTHDEHSPNQPLPRGAPFVCLNATTGDVVWRANGLFRGTQWGGTGVIGDSIIATMDTYDMQIYGVGRGPSQVTVSAPSVGVTTATPITISGTVMDISPGTSQNAIKLRFPNGVPAISDASQTDWMLYVYKQFSAPLNATGVPLAISVIDDNGNYREIGTTTSTPSGTFDFTWTPDIPGHYTLYASFAGSGAYYSSSAQTTFYAAEAATPLPTQTVQTGLATTSDLLMYMAVTAIAIIIAIAIATVLLLRKRP